MASNSSKKECDTVLGPDRHNALRQLFINLKVDPEILQMSLNLRALDVSHYSQTER